MLLLKRAHTLHDYLTKKVIERCSIGFVPTMGALHDGHVSLIRRSNAENNITVCSIYVNPTQFNDPKDLEKYPRPIEKDIEMLCAANCDLLFLPATEDIYPNGTGMLKHFDLGHLENFLEGASRPGHFQGVANVVDRLLEIVVPDRLYLGQKDFQQVKVLQKIVGSRSEGLSAPSEKSEVASKIPEIVMCDIVREKDGLAMSSRNVRLSSSQRKNAAGISQELFFIQERWKEFDLPGLKQQAVHRINSIPEAHVDYLEFCNADSFELIHDWNEANHIVCVTAVKLGDVRLLDNVLVK